MEDCKRTHSKIQIKRLPSDISLFSQQIVDFIKSVHSPSTWDKISLSIISFSTENRIWLSYRRFHSLKPDDICRVITLLMEIDPDFMHSNYFIEQLYS